MSKTERKELMTKIVKNIRKAFDTGNDEDLVYWHGLLEVMTAKK